MCWAATHLHDWLPQLKLGELLQPSEGFIQIVRLEALQLRLAVLQLLHQLLLALVALLRLRVGRAGSGAAEGRQQSSAVRSGVCAACTGAVCCPWQLGLRAEHAFKRP